MTTVEVFIIRDIKVPEIAWKCPLSAKQKTPGKDAPRGNPQTRRFFSNYGKKYEK